MKKNIVFPIEFDFINGGMVQSVLTLVNFLKKDYDIYILAYKDAEILKHTRDVNHLILKNNWSISISSPLKTLRTYIEVRSLLRDFPVESTLVITNNVGSELIFSGFGIKRIILGRFFVSRGGDYTGKTGFFLKQSFKSITKFIAISQRQVDVLMRKSIFRKDIILIHNGVENNILSVSDNNSQISNIAIVGFLHPLKNQLLAFKAIKKLKDLNYNFVLNVYGSASSDIDIEYKLKLDKFIIENNLQNVIVYQGYIHEKDKIYSKNQVLLSCSLSEGFGRTVVEAMSYSLSCIGLYESGGLLDIIENDYNGILIHNDVDELINALIKLYDNNDYRKYIEKNAFETYKSKFTDEIMCSKYKELIEGFFDKVI